MSRVLFVTTLTIVSLSVAGPVEAQRAYEPLFDKFNFKFEASWVQLGTEVRLDSETLGQGTTLNFEDDLDLAGGKSIPTLAFEWQIARKHKLGVRWQDIDRASSSQALTEIQWGDEIIPIEADINLGFDITQTFVDYTYYPWVKERWAAGFGLGFRVMDIAASLEWEAAGGIEHQGKTEAAGTGPLPYVYFEYRRLLSKKWRMITGLGFFYLKVGDIQGGQWIGRAGVEYLLGKRWGFGGAFNLSDINVDWKGLKNGDGDELYKGAVSMSIHDFSLFVRVRF